MSDHSHYLTLGIDREHFGIAIGRVREILEMRPVLRLPHAPAFLLGMIDVRGTSYPVVDLRTKLGLMPGDATDSTRIIIVDVGLAGGTFEVGLVADRVDEVTDLESEALERAPEVGATWTRRCIAGIGRKRGAFVIVLDVVALMEGDGAVLSTDAPAGRAAA